MTPLVPPIRPAGPPPATPAQRTGGSGVATGQIFALPGEEPVTITGAGRSTLAAMAAMGGMPAVAARARARQLARRYLDGDDSVLDALEAEAVAATTESERPPQPDAPAVQVMPMPPAFAPVPMRGALTAFLAQQIAQEFAGAGVASPAHVARMVGAYLARLAMQRPKPAATLAGYG